MLQCRTDLFLVGIGSAWLRYEAEYDKTAPQHQEDPTKPPPVDGQAQTYEPAAGYEAENLRRLLPLVG
jgi:hypothetical protein